MHRKMKFSDKAKKKSIKIVIEYISTFHKKKQLILNTYISHRYFKRYYKL